MHPATRGLFRGPPDKPRGGLAGTRAQHAVDHDGALDDGLDAALLDLPLQPPPAEKTRHSNTRQDKWSGGDCPTEYDSDGSPTKRRRMRPVEDPASPFMAAASASGSDKPTKNIFPMTGNPFSSSGNPIPPKPWLSPLLTRPLGEMDLGVSPSGPQRSDRGHELRRPLESTAFMGSASTALESSPYDDEDFATCPPSPSTPTTARTLVDPSSPPSPPQPAFQPKYYSIRTPRLSQNAESRLMEDCFLRLFEVLRHVQPSGPISPDAIDDLLDELVACPIQSILGILETKISSSLRKTPLVAARSSAWNPSEFQSISYSATFSRPPGDFSSLTLSLAPPEAELTTRVQHLVGADNILIISLDPKSIPPEKQRMIKPSTRLIELAGRRFEFLLSKSDGKATERAFYFAPTPTLSTRAALLSLVPPTPNLDMSFPKYISRLTLALSKCYRIPLPDVQIRVIPDIKSKTGHCMTDGCGLISSDLFQFVLNKLSKSRRSDSPTSGIQIRLGGAKGMLLSDATIPTPMTILLRESMVKYRYPGNGVVDGTPTLEVLKAAEETTAYLNSQFVLVLEGREVPKSVLIELEQEAASETLEHLFPTDGNPLRTARFLERSQRRNDVGQYDPHGLAEDEMDLWTEDVCWQMLTSGFDASEPYIRAKLLDFADREMEKRRVAARILVNKGICAPIVPDPYGILPPGHLVYISAESVPLVGDVLAMRNPCLLPSDIQRYTAVQPPPLYTGYRGVIIFSTQGTDSMASRLSGGDYDGDVVTLIWDPRLVEAFQPCAVHAEMEAVRDCFERQPPPILKQVADLDEEVWKSYAAQSESMLGMYTRWHAIAATHHGIASVEAVELAQICGRLVDAAKSGDVLQSGATERHKGLVEARGSVFWWDKRQAHKNGRKPAKLPPVGDGFLDQLASGSVPHPPLYNERMQQLASLPTELDEELLAPLIGARSLPDPSGAIARDLDKMRRQVSKLYGKWGSFWVANFENPASEQRKEEFKRSIVAEFRSILQDDHAWGVLDWPQTRWLFLASTAYQITRSKVSSWATPSSREPQGSATSTTRQPQGSGKFCFEVALDELKSIKAGEVKNRGRARDGWRPPHAIPDQILHQIRIAKQK